ncbi:MAG: single-stranded DNA-binding protein, partial [Nitrosopumilaceae archaeon]|nr:single-stranded DNA-binding protein [Nitrosopumilaceae archaeon]NIX60159.1 single-stranded DNA-binding protein [Nitrosopumilaceae archaeon]
MNINRVFIAGRITQTPEIRYTPNGSAVCEFSMATNRKYKSGDETKEETCFHSVVAWGKT